MTVTPDRYVSVSTASTAEEPVILITFATPRGAVRVERVTVKSANALIRQLMEAVRELKKEEGKTVLPVNEAK